MSDKLQFKCPHCSRALAISKDLVGRLGKCPACKQTFTIPVPGSQPTQRTTGQASRWREPAPTAPPPPSATPPMPRMTSQPSFRDELHRDAGRIGSAVSMAPDKYQIVEPFLMGYERPVAIAVQRQFPFSIFTDIVLLTSHRLLVFKRFFSKIDMVDVNYMDIYDVKIRQGFFTSELRIHAAGGRACTVGWLVTDQALAVYRFCQDIETKARIARRQFQLEENRSRTSTMQVNNVVAHPHEPERSIRGSIVQPQVPDLSAVGREERNPFHLGD